MRVKLGDRVAYITGKLRALSFSNIALISYRPGPSGVDGYYKLEAAKRDCRVFISELLIEGSVAKYSYTLLRNDKVILRYDNAPHHKHIETSPHHKHECNEIKPLHDYSIESFIREIADKVKGC
jgi:hypothetical protein